MAENYEIFRGTGTAEPDEIRDALGCLEAPDTVDVLPNVIGAIMTLCTRVAQLEAEVAKLLMDEEKETRR